jgi:hypothetical protein
MKRIVPSAEIQRVGECETAGNRVNKRGALATRAKLLHLWRNKAIASLKNHNCCLRFILKGSASNIIAERNYTSRFSREKRNGTIKTCGSLAWKGKEHRRSGYVTSEDDGSPRLHLRSFGRYNRYPIVL